MLQAEAMDKKQFDTVLSKSTKKSKVTELLRIMEASCDTCIVNEFLKAAREIQPAVLDAMPEMTGERFRLDLGSQRYLKVTHWRGEVRVDIRQYEVCVPLIYFSKCTDISPIKFPTPLNLTSLESFQNYLKAILLIELKPV
jgi:hypothetical protein